MKKLGIALVVIAVIVGGYFALQRSAAPEPPPPPVANELTLRTTTAGDVIGFIGPHGTRAWLGIPFASPPAAGLRWRAPVPPEPWSGTREALTVGNMCPQKPSQLSPDADPAAPVTGSEDCLYLNVWSPPNAANRPVMVWIHGGGNTIGDGGSYSGAALAAQQDLVVVTINYRLGPLGWFMHPALATGSPVDDSGNYGTLDIVRALEWTRDNIARFGGDPDNVTLFGESAGAFDTLAMMASPLAKGLFHRAISQSGGFRPTPVAEAQNHAAEGGHPYSAREIVNRLLVADGRVADPALAADYQNDMNPAALREYLYGKTTEEIFSLWENGGFGMINTPDTFRDGHVIPDLDTAGIFSSPDNHNMVPVILGTNRDEPALFTARSPEYVRNFLWVFPRLRDEEGYRRMVEYGGMAWKARGVDELADLMHQAGNEQVFAYRFDWDELPTIGGYDLSKALGAAHAIEIPFVFGDFEDSWLAYLFDGATGHQELSSAIMSYWAEFAYRGDPNGGRDGANPAWHAWNHNGHTSLVLDSPADGGIRMIDQRVTREYVLAALAEDPGIRNQQERCSLYRTTFGFGGGFDLEEYLNLGDEGCPRPEPEPAV